MAKIKTQDQATTQHQLELRLQRYMDSLGYGEDPTGLFKDMLSHYLYINSIYKVSDEDQTGMFKLEDGVKAPFKESKEKNVEGLINTIFKVDFYGDLLGTTYQYLSSRGHKSSLGQFFTPYDISRFMAELVFPMKKDQDAEFGNKQYISVLDCCCGSGGMLIAAKEVMDKYEIKKPGLFVGSDIDPVCVMMTLAHMVRYGMEGIVAHMNALSLKVMYLGVHVVTSLKKFMERIADVLTDAGRYGDAIAMHLRARQVDERYMIVTRASEEEAEYFFKREAFQKAAQTVAVAQPRVKEQLSLLGEDLTSQEVHPTYNKPKAAKPKKGKAADNDMPSLF